MIIVMLALYVTISERFAIEMYKTLTFKFATAKYNYANRKPVCDFRLGNNSNVCSICQCLRDNHGMNLIMYSI